MKSETKSKKSIAAVFAALAFAFISTPILAVNARAEEEDGGSYQYKLLNVESRKFYDALTAMESSGAFKSGNGSYDLIQNGVLTAADVQAYANGHTYVLERFGAAKDVYYLDHPEIFYVDFDLLSVSLGTKGGEPYAVIDAGRTGSYYAAGFASASDVDAAISRVNTAANAFVSTLDSSMTAEQKAAAVDTYVCENTAYGFEDQTKPGAENNIRNIYGILGGDGLSVCEGYARTYKYLCNRAGLECEEIVGYLYDESSDAMEPHAWNYVNLGGTWYLVDSTLNDSMGAQTYLFRGQEGSTDHFEDGKISQSGYTVDYPLLAERDIGGDKIHVEQFYGSEVNPNDPTKTKVNYVSYNVSYNGMNVSEAEANGLYLAYRTNYSAGSGYEWSKYMRLPFVMEHKDGYTVIKALAAKTDRYIQFIFTSTPPTGEMTFYDDPAIAAESEALYNGLFDITSYRPYVNSVHMKNTVTGQEHSNSAMVPAVKYEVSLSYSDDVTVKEGGSLAVSIEADAKDIQDYVKIENVRFESGALKFDFTPSMNYGHNGLNYTFIVDGLVSVGSGLSVINNGGVSIGIPNIACSRVFGDGRLYIDTFGSPTLIDNSDLSINGWTYGEDKKGAVDGQRTQLAMVVSTPSAKEQSDMAGGAGEVLSAKTYQLDMDLCRKIVNIPKGSFLKMAMPYPDGFDRSSLADGVTFKIFHFEKGEDGTIDYANPVPLDCVFTEYGIVVTVDNFSPFMVAAVKAEENAAKTVYARTINSFGTVVRTGENVTPIAKITEGQIEYVITPDSGYEIDYVILNGKIVTDSVANGKIVLDYAELGASNELSVAFVASDVKQYEKANNIENYNSGFAANQIIRTAAPSDPASPDSGVNVAAIVVPIVVVAVVAAAVVTFFVIRRKKNGGDNGNNSGGDKSVNKSASAAVARTAPAAEKPATSPTDERKTPVDKSTTAAATRQPSGTTVTRQSSTPAAKRQSSETAATRQSGSSAVKRQPSSAAVRSTAPAQRTTANRTTARPSAPAQPAQRTAANRVASPQRRSGTTHTGSANKKK